MLPPSAYVILVSVCHSASTNLLLKHGASPDFQTGVRAVLIEKTKGRPAWSPPTLAEIKLDEIHTKFFGQYSPENGTAPALEVPQGIEVNTSKTGNPMRFALPTEVEIRQLVRGDHPASGGSALTKKQLIEKVMSFHMGKMGVREKVLDVIERKCVEVANVGDDEKYLKWRG